MIEPYYQDDHCTIYHGDCLDILPQLEPVDVVITDPPYGTSERRNYKTRQRSSLAQCNDYNDIVGDFEPFVPDFLLGMQLPTILWGGNHYANKLPSSACWLVWDKLDGLKTDKRDIGFNDQADIEIAWTNLSGVARLYKQRWMGAMKSGERKKYKRVHPTEKPLELMRWCIKQTPLGLILDCYMGSGTTLRAAKDLGRKAIGIEIEEKYCEIAVKRLQQEVLTF